MGNQLINKNEIRRCSSPSPPLDTTTVLSSLTRMLPLRLCLTPSWFPPSNPPSTPPSPRPLPSRTSRRLSPLESSRDLMMDNHSSRLPERGRPSRVCSHRSTIWREDLVLCSPLSQSLRTPSRPSRKSSMSEEWERNEQPNDK